MYKIKNYFKEEYDMLYIDFRKSYLEKNGVESPLHQRVVKPIDWDWVRNQLKAKCSNASIARGLSLHFDTIKRRCWDDLGMSFQELRAECEAIGEDLLRKKMFDIAVNGDTKMLIWLSKALLGYSEKQQKEEEEKTQPTVNFIYNEKPKI
jgi:hypothetical protein